MATCIKCGRYNDRYEWPVEDRPDYQASICHRCYLAEQEGTEEPEELQPQQPTLDPSEEDVFPDEDDGCMTDDDPEDQEDEQ